LSLLPNPPGRLWPGFIVRDFADGAPVACLQAVPSNLATERRCEFCSRHACFPGRVERHQARRNRCSAAGCPREISLAARAGSPISGREGDVLANERSRVTVQGLTSIHASAASPSAYFEFFC